MQNPSWAGWHSFSLTQLEAQVLWMVRGKGEKATG